MLTFFKPRAFKNQSAQEWYKKIVIQSRIQDFYTQYQVPDTLDGRFELILLHMFMILWIFKKHPSSLKKLGQNLFDLMVIDMDRSLREIGVGDLSVGKKMKVILEAFYGRIQSYEKGLENENSLILQEALKRNLYGTIQVSEQAVSLMSKYIQQQIQYLTSIPLNELLSAHINFNKP